jgi:fibronectin type 3 domain-containing protein
MRRLLRRCALAAVAPLVLACAPAAYGATSWTVVLHAGSRGQAKAQAVPAAPTATATCSLVALKITVTWTAVAHASSYTVYQSSNGANGTYSVVASGLTGTSFTSAVLVLGTYYYEVTATVGSNWTTAHSAATAGHTITIILCT